MGHLCLRLGLEALGLGFGGSGVHELRFTPSRGEHLDLQVQPGSFGCGKGFLAGVSSLPA